MLDNRVPTFEPVGILFLPDPYKKASPKGGTAVLLFCMSYGGLVLFGDNGKGRLC